MQVKVLSFGVLKDWLGAAAATVELSSGSTVGQLLESLRVSRSSDLLQGIAVSVNAEFASTTQILQNGDEVALLPPVSGGCGESAQPPITIALTHDPIPTEKLIAASKRGEDGAVVIFDGIVRNNTRGRRTLYLDYEAYEEMALRQMTAIAHEAPVRFGVRGITLIHRLGRMEIGDTSVLILVTSAHRVEAFAACRWLIDTLKTQVPIWKKETFADGSVWAAGEPFPEGIAL